ncbi:MAG: CHAD domain-containing protein [Gammaproteobacteria bacterium]|nr:CHAD domain-containing protein [Gammaproteobacteria bacterium]
MNDSKNSGFLLPHNMGVERLVKRLGGEARCRIGESADFTLRFFDSFDWRLHEAGLRLLQLRSPQGAVLRLKSAEAGDPLDAVAFDAEPAWPADLPESQLKTEVEKRLAMRVLLPVATVTGEATDLALLNEDAKTVVRLQFLAMRCDAEGIDEPRVLWPRLRLLPVKGYQRDLSDFRDFLAGEMEWPEAPECLFDEVVTAVGREPGDYSSKLDVSLRPDQTAVDATRKVLRSLLNTLERNIPGTRADLDSEFLHDLRVATRRTRSVLSQVKQVLPEDVVVDFKQRFAWLGQVTGPVRDLDVFLLELPRYRASLPSSMAGDLDGLEEHLLIAHGKEQASLKRKLGSAEMRKLVEDWHKVLEPDTLPGEPAPLAELPIGQVASSRIWRMYKKVLKAGRAVTADGPAEEMHELRKDCKKLRYLIEFFQSLYPRKELKELIRALKVLLDNLGEFQDLEVQADKLRSFAKDFDPQDPHSMPTVMAIGALVADLLGHQQAAHDRFADCFDAFDSAANRARYTHLFKDWGEVQG